MLAVPVKLSGAPPAWQTALPDHVARSYGGPAVAAEYARDVTRVVTSRARAVAATSADADSIGAVRAYLRVLVQLERKFPSLRGGEGNPEWKSLVFTWNDAFRPKKAASQTDAELDRAALTFNLGALESLAGMQQDRHTVDGIKAALGHFQAAAGAFAALLEGVHNPSGAALGPGDGFALKGPYSSDLSLEGLSMLKSLMLAQAQVCYLEKATKDAMKPSVTSKLAVEASKLYDAALQMANTPTLQPVLDKGWAAYIEFHRKQYEAWAEYYAAQATIQRANESGDGYGEEIARLRRADAAARAAAEIATRHKLPAGVLASMSNLVKRVHADEVRAVEDNNKIYMNPVPDASSLGLPPGALLAKAVPPALEQLPEDQELFRDLAFPWVKTAEAVFHSKLEALVREYGDKVERRTGEIRLGLAEAGLPASVESTGTASSDVPDLAWKRVVDNVVSAGGVAALVQEASANRASCERCESMLLAVESALAEEESKDAAARARGFKGESSQRLNASMRSDLAKYRHAVQAGRTADEQLAAKLRANVGVTDLLTKTRAQVAAWLPPDGSAEADASPQVEQARVELSMLLVSLGVKVQEVELAQASLVEVSSQDSIADKLEQPTEVQRVMDAALAEYRSATSDVDAKLASLNALFSQILEKNHSFAAMRHQNDASRRREAALKELDDAVAKYAELIRSVREGARFYEELTMHVSQLKSVVDDFCFVRGVERDEFDASAARSSAAQAQAQASASDYAAVPLGYGEAVASYDWGGMPSSSPPPQAQTQPPQQPARAAPARPSVVAAADPQLAGLPADKAGAVLAMRDFLGAEAQGVDLKPYLERNNWDANAAINAFLENPPARPAATAVSSTSVPVAQPAQAIPVAKKKGGWFR